MLSTQPDASGPVVARLFHVLLSVIFLGAWLSLWAQVELLMGARGLTPAAALIDRVRGSPTHGFWDLPTHLWFDASDTAIQLGCLVGVALAVLGLAGVGTRLCLVAGSLLYLGYCHAASTFLAFQWDNLLVEAGLLSGLLSRDRRSPWAHLALRALLFKLFFESGLAKWQSPRGDWHDGSAMTHYYETAPLPTALAWFAHHLPGWWHAVEGWWALFFELILSWGVFFGRRARLVALAAFSSFLLVDAATANYGFFCHLSLVLCVFLLSDRDVMGVARWGRRLLRLSPRSEPDAPPAGGGPAVWLRRGLLVLWALVSLDAGLARFAGVGPQAPALVSAARTLRAANVYHLFTSITVDRVEPDVQVSEDGVTFTSVPFRYKPGPLDRAPAFVAPHQPRVDFRLWFHGLSWTRRTPPMVVALVRRLCHEPDVVQDLFVDDLPTAPKAVRLVYWDYRFTSPAGRAESGHWWTREQVGATPDLDCGDVAP